MIRVIDLRVKPWPYMVYVGRPFAGLPGHDLANPFALKKGQDTTTHRDLVLRRYREHLAGMKTLEARLWELFCDTEGGRLPLSCWCGMWPQKPDLRCHAVVLAEMLTERFNVKEE